MTRFLCIAFLALAVVIIASPAVQAQYVIEQTVNGGFNPWIKGQTFTPSIGIDPDPGPVSTLDLTAITFYRSNQGWSGPTSHFYLNIYDDDPVNGTGNFVGSSTHSIDVALLGNYSPMTWTFNYLALDYTHEYWALVSSTNTDGGLDVYCGMREGANDPYAGGTSIAGLKNDPGGYHVKSDIDLAFKIDLKDTHSLIADTTTLLESAGTVNFEIDAGSAYAGRAYLLLGGISGTEPGTPMPGGMVTLPMNWDLFTRMVISLVNTPVFPDFWGMLDAEGKAFPAFEWPGYPGSAGLKFYFAACTLSPCDFATNPWTVSIIDPEPPSKELFVAYMTSNEIFHLGKIDYLNPESVQDIGSLGHRFFRSLEFAGDGKLYAYEDPLWNPGQLYKVNPANGALTPIGGTSSQRIDGMAYNPVDGKMYGVDATTSTLLSIDLNTGSITFEGTFQDDGPISFDWYSGIAVDESGYFYIYNNAKGISVSEQGVYRSKDPGGLELEMIYDLRAEFGHYGTALSLQTPAPLFFDWSSEDGNCYGWLREWDSYQITGWFGYHWNQYGVLSWDHYPVYPTLNKMLYAWTAPPGP